MHLHLLRIGISRPTALQFYIVYRPSVIAQTLRDLILLETSDHQVPHAAWLNNCLYHRHHMSREQRLPRGPATGHPEAGQRKRMSYTFGITNMTSN
jgi:hypothetical protein